MPSNIPSQRPKKLGVPYLDQLVSTRNYLARRLDETKRVEDTHKNASPTYLQNFYVIRQQATFRRLLLESELEVLDSQIEIQKSRTRKFNHQQDEGGAT